MSLVITPPAVWETGRGGTNRWGGWRARYNIGQGNRTNASKENIFFPPVTLCSKTNTDSIEKCGKHTYVGKYGDQVVNRCCSAGNVAGWCSHCRLHELPGRWWWTCRDCRLTCPSGPQGRCPLMQYFITGRLFVAFPEGRSTCSIKRDSSRSSKAVLAGHTATLAKK